MQNMPSITRQDERESYRIEGEISYGDRDVRGYRSVTAFIQRGLGSQTEVVRQVLGIATRVQNANNLPFLVVLFSFGWDDGILHGNGRSRTVGPNMPCNGWATELCELASAENSLVPQKTPSLFQPASPTGAPLKAIKEDLLIFFCKDRSVRLTDEAMARYVKPLKHAVWIYCEDDKIEMAFGIKESIMITENKPAKETETRKEPKMKLCKSEAPKKSGDLTCTSKSCRGLTKEFRDDLKTGTLANILAVVKADHTLSLNIRNGYVNIYYRGGSLLKITEKSKHRYSFEFDNKYLASAGFSLLGIATQTITSLPGKITAEDQDGVDRWVHHIPALQAAMNMWLGEHPHLEREFQQLVERMNNRNTLTDYIICDIEYTNTKCRELRADLIALNWPYKTGERARSDNVKLSIVEMKHGDGALASGSGLVAHINELDNKLGNAAITMTALGQEMVSVFNQRVELGLIESKTIDDVPPKIKMSKPEDVEYIILLSDHYPASSILLRELTILKSAPPSHFTIKVALATFTGYGLFEENVYTLDQFMSRFSKQIKSSPKSGNNSCTLSSIGAPIRSAARASR